MSSALPTGIQLTTLDQKFREDPYPILAELRKRDPIHHDTQLGRFFFTRHKDVFEILRDPDYWSDPRKGNEGGFARGYLSRGDEEPPMLMMDNPGHRRLRELVRHPFAPRAIERWRGHAREVATRVVGASVCASEDEFDLISKIANPIPTIVIAEMLGVDPDRHDQLSSWSDAVIKVAFSPMEDPEGTAAAEEARAKLSSLFMTEIERRHLHPGDDLISSMVAAEELGDRLTDAEIAQQCELLLLAGNLTTSDLIGNAVMALLRNPDQLEMLRVRPELMTNTVEEVLRYDSSVTDSGRIANKDIVIDGIEIQQGESMTLCLAAANRDPATYPDPDRFDIKRMDTHHQSFGGGRHFCLGAHLARIELAETLSALIAEFPRMSFGDGGHRYAANPSFRGLADFWVHVER